MIDTVIVTVSIITIVGSVGYLLAVLLTLGIEEHSCGAVVVGLGLLILSIFILLPYANRLLEEQAQETRAQAERRSAVCWDKYKGTVGREKVGGTRNSDVYEEFCYGINIKIPTSAL